MKTSGPIFALGLLLLAACQGSIDPAKVATDIQADGAKNGVSFSEVTCPPGQAATVGGTFQCNVRDDRGTAGTYTVTVKDAKGAVAVKLDQKAVDLKDVGNGLAGQLSQSAGGAKVDVSCPDKKIIAKQGVVVVCDATSGSSTRKVILTCKSADGDFDIAFQ
jgi:hypothetical protein